MKKKLIIWDFDGVIADTDYIWIENLYKNMKSKFNIKDSLSDFYTKYNGMSSITQRIIFNDLGYKTSNYFWKNLRNEFRMIEMKRFNIVNNYVMGIVKISDVNSFKDNLFNFRNKLYAIPINDDNLLEIAKMKSKIQHYNTEVLEDEELLRLAYSNSN